ncbi:alanine racemase [Krasilnikovia sp. MM14-A1004]|uniref:alanine racemase n=1 Tax=Krasilnikovia sp. MM14-A1004 TaxID=3373541 RepID=UPI00399C631F
MTLDIPDERIDWRSKGFWLPDGPVTAAQLAAARPGLFDGGFTWPMLVLRRSAAAANIATMAAFCARHGLDFAPHAKTTMAPGLLAAQLDAGAWGMTVATANQALVLRRLGVPRVVIANQVLDPTALRWLAQESARGWEVYLQVDSEAGVAAAAAAIGGPGSGAVGSGAVGSGAVGSDPGGSGVVGSTGTGGRLRVLVELGHSGGRTGCRTVPQLVVVARAVTGVAGLELCGVTGYEGALDAQAEVDAFLSELADGARALAAAGLLGPRVLVSAGGSAWFDRVAALLAGQWLPGHELRTVLRSGASVTHDDGMYADCTPFRRVPAEGPLAAALDLYAQVLSVPEPGLALVGMGKRDAPFDGGLPVPRSVRRPDGTAIAADGLAVTRLNDHHAYLKVAPGAVLTPGDIVRFGISHPCTAFDKWRHIPVVDDDLRVVDVLHTYF